MSSPLPCLRTERLELLPVEHAVAVALAAGRETGLRHAPGWPHADTLDAVRGYAEHGAPGDDGGWLATRREDGAVVGDLGWRGGPDAGGEAEIGYGLAAPSRGRGYGTEAVGAMVAWCLRQPGLSALTARVELGNTASRRLLERLGFAVRGTEGIEVVYALPVSASRAPAHPPGAARAAAAARTPPAG